MQRCLQQTVQVIQCYLVTFTVYTKAPGSVYYTFHLYFYDTKPRAHDLRPNLGLSEFLCTHIVLSTGAIHVIVAQPLLLTQPEITLVPCCFLIVFLLNFMFHALIQTDS